MADQAKIRVKVRKSRHARVRRTVTGTNERPRLCVRRSVIHVYAQIIDDVTGKSLCQLSSLDKEIKTAVAGKSKMEISKIVGQKIGSMATEKGIAAVVFDRGGFLYHGRVKALADGARESGLKF